MLVPESSSERDITGHFPSGQQDALAGFGGIVCGEYHFSGDTAVISGGGEGRIIDHGIDPGTGYGSDAYPMIRRDGDIGNLPIPFTVDEMPNGRGIGVPGNAAGRTVPVILNEAAF
ncbi:MAG: hypothetical protein KAH38_06885, partial [Candidatus Hydrogenedentes bacterium]|nr:hypothetical protein [Candidatus Hydrogenedentota bacterium]